MQHIILGLDCACWQMMYYIYFVLSGSNWDICLVLLGSGNKLFEGEGILKRARGLNDGVYWWRKYGMSHLHLKKRRAKWCTCGSDVLLSFIFEIWLRRAGMANADMNACLCCSRLFCDEFWNFLIHILALVMFIASGQSMVWLVWCRKILKALVVGVSFSENPWSRSGSFFAMYTILTMILILSSCIVTTT